MPNDNFLTKILIPFDGSPAARAAVRFAAAMVQESRAGVEQITLLHVTGGGYLARHLQNVDLRVLKLEQTAEWQRLRENLIEREIRPQLAASRDILVQGGVQAPIDVQILEGKIGERILAAARQGEYTAVIMGRRGLSPLQELFLGSVTQYVLSHAQGLTVFVVGQERERGSAGSLFPLLLPVDGSAASLAAVRQGVQLAQACQGGTPRLLLLHVVDLALLGQTLTTEAQAIIDEGRKALAQARNIPDQAGLQGCTVDKLLSGIPAQVIAQEVREQHCPLVLMGSVGHSVFGRLLIGSVTQSVVHLASQATIGVVYPEREQSF